MRQAFRRYAFPMMIIAAVLAAALPLNSFALDISSVSLYDDFATNCFGLYNWNYLYDVSNSYYSYGHFSSKCSISPVFEDDFGGVDNSVSFPVLSRTYKFTAPFSGKHYFRFDLPIFLKDIYSIDFDFFFTLLPISGSSLIPNFTSVILHTDSSSIDLVWDRPIVDYKFLYSDSDFPDYPQSSFIHSRNISYSSTSSFDANYISFFFYVDHSSVSSYFLTFALYPNVSVSTLSSNVSSLMQGQELIVRLLDTSIAQDASNNALIIDRLDQILAAVEAGGSGGSGSDPGTGEGEEILQEGAIKQEQLEQLGDALSNVPKPSIENITQSFDPADTLISADPDMIQNALSIVYSWDKFLILLGLFIAVGTISYIIFGKKS